MLGREGAGRDRGDQRGGEAGRNGGEAASVHTMINMPVLGPDGDVKWILHSLEASADNRDRSAMALALDAAEARLRSILQTVPDAMIIIDDRGRIESLSTTAERLFGYAMAELAGRNVSELMPSPDREQHDVYLKRYLTTGERRIIGIGRIVVGQRKDGTTFPMHLTVGELRSAERHYFTGFIRDLTDQQLTETRLKELQSELTHMSHHRRGMAARSRWRTVPAAARSSVSPCVARSSRRRTMTADGVVHVIDDDADVRQSLAFLLSTAGLAVRVHDSALAFLKVVPDINGCVVTDIRMPGMDGLELQRRLSQLRVCLPVIVMTGHGDVPLAVEAMKAGAVDFIEKPFDDEVMLSAIRTALARQADDRGRNARAAAVQERIARLSGREREVLDRLVAGKANKVIAYELGISARTVEVYRANVMTKMQADSLSELVRMALIESSAP